MKPPKGTIQWLAPHLSDGEVQAIYEAMIKVIGEDYPLIPSGITHDPSDAVIAINYEKSGQRKELSRLFGKREA